MRFTLVLSLIFVSNVVFGTPVANDFIDSSDEVYDIGKRTSFKQLGFIPVPVVITEPATGYGGGAVALFLHDSEKSSAKESDKGFSVTPPAMTIVGAAGTQNGTWGVVVGHRRSWLDDSIRYQVGSVMGVGNIEIYTDLGGLLDNSNRVSFDTSTQLFGIQQKLSFRLSQSKWFLGINQLWVSSKTSSNQTIVDDLFKFFGSDSTNNSALGLFLEYDSRNNYFYPTQGIDALVEYIIHGKKLGSDFDYSTYKADVSSYFNVFSNTVFSLRANLKGIQYNNPFLLPTLRPYVDMRGVAAYRYQGDQVVTIQAQLGYDFTSKWSILGFYGLGLARSDVASLNYRGIQLNNQTITNHVSSIGAGFRYNLLPSYGVRVGLDVAKSRDQSAFYINIGTGL